MENSKKTDTTLCSKVVKLKNMVLNVQSFKLAVFTEAATNMAPHSPLLIVLFKMRGYFANSPHIMCSSDKVFTANLSYLLT